MDSLLQKLCNCTALPDYAHIHILIYILGSFKKHHFLTWILDQPPTHSMTLQDTPKKISDIYTSCWGCLKSPKIYKGNSEKYKEKLRKRIYPFWKRLLSGRVPDNNFLLSGTPLKCPYVLAGYASGCWLSALGAGMHKIYSVLQGQWLAVLLDYLKV